MRKTRPDLAGIPETMLWTLHNRASEARRPGGVLHDPEAVRIYEALDYDYQRSFGRPEGSHAARAAEIDRLVRRWLEAHPDGVVVSLGEGLETAVHRVDNRRLRWLSVDLPDALRVRELFLAPTPRCRHLGVSALDPRWMDAVDPAEGVFVIAQGLLMYFTPDEVRRLVADIAGRFPGCELAFDTIPRWFSAKTVAGMNRTRHYRLPPMPWGIDQQEIEPTLRSWHPRIAEVRLIPYLPTRGPLAWIFRLVVRVPFLRRKTPVLVWVRTADGDQKVKPPVT
jgi:O-methyltransferase involved in polyketide biosynthesis